jgi:hypothetical protein
MAGCVACSKALTLDIEPEEEEAGSSASNGSYVDDDVQLQCGCHFHWSVSSIQSFLELKANGYSIAQAMFTRCLHHD